MKATASERGFILIFSLLLLLGIGVMAAAMIYNAHHAHISSVNFMNRTKAFYGADGLRSLLAQEILDGNHRLYLDTVRSGEIRGEVYGGAGRSLAGLRTASLSPPAREAKSDYLGSNWKNEVDYGVIWKGLLVAPATGNYTFYVRADDRGAFFLSTDERPAKLSPQPIAWAESPAFLWPVSGTAVSAGVTLKQGKRYYFEFLHGQEGGPGFGQVGWRGPQNLSERPIPGRRLHKPETPGEIWDTTALNGVRVRYSMQELGSNVYSTRTEAFFGGPEDSAYRSPLEQVLNMRGPYSAPPETSWQRVIFYDFHADRSNPEFERKPEWGLTGVRQGMVRKKGLAYATENADYFGRDSIGKPMLGNPQYNCGVDKWFRPWRPGWFRTFAYEGGASDCRETALAHDRAFINQVFKDSLPFRRRADLGANAYQFRRFTPPLASQPGFTPLDGRGFGSEGRLDLGGTPHNYGFCMELHTRFEHTSGLYFEFNGDDDVWLYLDDSLVMDIGYVHSSTSANLSLDDLPLKFGETYSLDFFYCERQSTGTSIDLITNLPMARPSGSPRPDWKRDYGDRN